MKLKLSLFLNVFLAICLAVIIIHRLQNKPVEHPPKNKIPVITSDFTYRYKTDHFIHRRPPPGAIVMLGDSLTDLGGWSEFFPKYRVLNRGISGDTTEGILARLDEVLSRKPSKIFLMAGTNDLFNGGGIDNIAARYEEIINRVEAAKIPLYIESVIPMNGSMGGSYNSLDNDRINALNARLKQIAETHNLAYIDINSSLVKNGVLDKELSTDGIHLNGAAYSIWVNKIKTYLED